MLLVTFGYHVGTPNFFAICTDRNWAEQLVFTQCTQKLEWVDNRATSLHEVAGQTYTMYWQIQQIEVNTCVPINF